MRRVQVLFVKNINRSFTTLKGTKDSTENDIIVDIDDSMKDAMRSSERGDFIKFTWYEYGSIFSQFSKYTDRVVLQGNVRSTGRKAFSIESM